MLKEQEKVIYTIGTSNRTLEEFIRILKLYRIEILVDVRRFPTSKFEHFKKENLKAEIGKAGIRYHYLGEELGGYREGGYLEYVKTEKFANGLEKLVKIASKGRTALMCCEKFPWKCHRRFIGYELIKKGWKVMHVIDKDRVWIPKGKAEMLDDKVKFLQFDLKRKI